MFGTIGDPGTLDRIVSGLAWAILGLSLLALAAGLVGVLSAPLYLAALILIPIAGLALRRRHELSSPIEHPQYRDLLTSLSLGTLLLFAIVATVLSVGLMARFDVIQFETAARNLIVLAHIVLTLGFALLAGALQAALRVESLEERAIPPAVSWVLFAAAIGLIGLSIPVGLGHFTGSLLSGTRFEWVFYAGAGLLGAQIVAILQLGLPGPLAVAGRINERLDLKSRKRMSLAVVGILAGFYALLWMMIHVVAGPELGLLLPGIDPIFVLIPLVVLPEAALILLTVKEVRDQEDKPFYDRSMKLGVLGFSAGLTGLFVLLFLLTRTVDFLVFTILAATGPYGFYEFARLKHLRKMEEKLPDLLRDLAEYWKGGLSMTDAIETLSKGEYGELTPEVRKMAVQLSWGVSFDRVLELFAERVNTQLVHRAVSLIREADRAGGKISDILEAAANDAREIKWLERERQSNMGIYVAIIYMAFGVFLAVIVIIAAQFLPAIISATASLGGGGQIGSVQITDIDRDFVVLVFFSSALIQSIGSGMVGGVMGEGEPSAGMKHVFVMVVISYLVFRVIVGL